MRMHFRLTFGLALLLALSGCCCPMNCSSMMSYEPNCCYPQQYCAPAYCAQPYCSQACCPQPYCPQVCCPQTTWSEHLEDAYYNVSDCVHYHACHLQHNVSRSMRRLAANLTPSNNYYGGENDYTEMPPSAKVPPISADSQNFSRRKRGKLCSRCKQSPCRCGYGEEGDGFEEVGPNSADTGDCQGQCESAPAGYPAQNLQEPQAAPPYSNPGPTPIYQTPPTAPAAPGVAPTVPPEAPESPPAPADNQPTANVTRPTAPRIATASRPATRVSAQSMEPRRIVTPIESAVPAEEEYKLRPINFSTHAPLTQKDGWAPVPAGQK